MGHLPPINSANRIAHCVNRSLVVKPQNPCPPNRPDVMFAQRVQNTAEGLPQFTGDDARGSQLRDNVVSHRSPSLWLLFAALEGKRTFTSSSENARKGRKGAI
jgi:hypothetical protein